MAMLTGSKGELLRVILSAQPYKPGQGSYARNGTLIGFGVLIVGAMYAWSEANPQVDMLQKWGIPLAFGAIAGWIAYRLVHYSRFADFLITTEAEMNKVSWPSKPELKASTLVVLVYVVMMAAFLFAADTFWKYVLGLLGILKIGGLYGGGSTGMFHIPPTLWMLDLVLAWLN